MKWIIAFVYAFMISAIEANEAGFVYQGKRYVVYKNGEKVGKTHEEMMAEKGREPSSKISKGYVSILTYEEDELARCYRQAGGTTENLHCVKK